jgi:hypothetical protein
MTYRLVNVAPDGAFTTDGPFDTIEDTWEFCDNMGSRWYFYPMPFVALDGTLEIVDVPNHYDPGFVGLRAGDLKHHVDALIELWDYISQ